MGEIRLFLENGDTETYDANTIEEVWYSGLFLEITFKTHVLLIPIRRIKRVSIDKEIGIKSGWFNEELK